MKVGIISGYFNPIHTGHLDYIDGAKDKCDFLFVIGFNFVLTQYLFESLKFKSISLSGLYKFLMLCFE